jgi:hypothetical protein
MAKSKLTPLADEYVRQLEVGKTGYDKARETFARILQSAKPGDQIPLSDKNSMLEIVDQFADRNIVWKPAGVERFTGKVRRAVDVTSKL